MNLKVSNVWNFPVSTVVGICVGVLGVLASQFANLQPPWPTIALVCSALAAALGGMVGKSKVAPVLPGGTP